MATYKLEETPNTFVSPFYLDNRFIYRMVHFTDETNYVVVRDIDLRKDKLSIYGTEIKEPILQKLYDSLRLRPATVGRIYVNCNGACYIVMVQKGICRSIDNIIFDWSRFGVIVPNSVNDVLRKQLQHKDDEFESSNNEVKQRVTELEEQLSLSKSENEKMKSKVQIMQDQLSSIEDELQSTKIKLESSSKAIVELESQLDSCMKENENSVTELHKVQNELSNRNLELQLTKTKLESSYEKLKQLEEELSACKKEKEAKEAELYSLSMNELQSMKIMLEFAEREDDRSLGECYVIKAIEIVEDVTVN